MSQDPSPVLDVEAALLHCASKQDLMVRLLHKLCDIGTRDADEILRAVEARETDEAARLGHRLKGSAAALGAERVREAAAAVETACKSGAEAQPLALELREEIAELAQEIESRFGTREG